MTLDDVIYLLSSPGWSGHAFLPRWQRHPCRFSSFVAESHDLGLSVARTELLSAMLNDDDGLAGIAAKYTTRQVGRELSKLASQGYPLTQRRMHATRVWDINIAELSKGDDDEKAPF
jgi:hypothetical protein